jgi:putative transposase
VKNLRATQIISTKSLTSSIPKNQRYIGRPGLAELLKGTKRRKEISRKAKEAVERYGYSQKEVADYLGIHYSTVSRLVNKGILDYARNKT